MQNVSNAFTDKQRWLALAKINSVSALSQVVQIGAVTPLLSLSLEKHGVDSVHIGLVVSASWLAILLLYKIVPRLLVRLGLVRACVISAALTAGAVLGMAVTQDLLLLFGLNFALGAGLILRWIACDTWIVSLAAKSQRGRAIGVHETLMGLGIAVGPLLLAVLGVDSALPYYASAVLVGVSGVLSVSLRAYDVHPPAPVEKHQQRMLGVIPLALGGAFIAGFSETSAVAFLASYSLSVGYLMAAAVLLVSTFGLGGTLLQLPIGWLADRRSYKTGQVVCALVLVSGAALLPLCQSLPWLAALLVFLWGGAIGGMNTLAVIEAGERVGEQQLSTAMTSIALFYTLGSLVGPIITGGVISYVSSLGLVISAGVVGALFIAVLALAHLTSRR